jgi:hypothetical protein
VITSQFVSDNHPHKPSETLTVSAEVFAMTVAPKHSEPVSEEDSIHASNNVANEAAPPKKQPSRKKWFIIGAIVLLVVLVLSLTLGLYYGLKKVCYFQLIFSFTCMVSLAGL